MGMKRGSGIVGVGALVIGTLCAPSAQAGLVEFAHNNVVYAALGDSFGVRC